MYNGKEHTGITDLDKLIVGELCKEIIGPRHEVDWSRYEDPNEEIDMIIQDKIDREGGKEL